MLAEPKLEDRGEQPYAAIRTRVTMNDIDATLPPLIPEVYAWLQRQGVPPAGPPFFRYLVIDMARELEVEVGVPVATAVRGDDCVSAGALPAGRYATALHTGPYDQLIAATATLLAWAEETQLKAPICRKNVIADARPCTPVPPGNLHGGAVPAVLRGRAAAGARGGGGAGGASGVV